MQSKKTIFSLIIFLFLFSNLLAFLPAQAIDGDDLWGGTDKKDEVSTETGLGDQDPRTLVAKIIQVLLGFLGIIAVVLIVYAGFLWMTSAGNEEKVSTAKKILTASAIGLAIVLMSFALANLIISELADAAS